jgi:hypothetical protein
VVQDDRSSHRSGGAVPLPTACPAFIPGISAFFLTRQHFSYRKIIAKKNKPSHGNFRINSEGPK